MFEKQNSDEARDQQSHRFVFTHLALPTHASAVSCSFVQELILGPAGSRNLYNGLGFSLAFLKKYLSVLDIYLIGASPFFKVAVAKQSVILTGYRQGGTPQFWSGIRV